MIRLLAAAFIFSSSLFGSVTVNKDKGTYTVGPDGCVPHEKIYIDEEDLKVEGDSFHIHIGGNIWICTDTIHRNSSGMYTYGCSLNRLTNMEYERKWKCPYCYRYWPIGKPCDNPDCPSRY